MCLEDYNNRIAYNSWKFHKYCTNTSTVTKQYYVQSDMYKYRSFTKEIPRDTWIREKKNRYIYTRGGGEK